MIIIEKIFNYATNYNKKKKPDNTIMYLLYV